MEATNITKTYVLAKRIDHQPTFITLKDHKDNHSNKPSFCLINLTKNELGKTSTKSPTHVKKVGHNSEFPFGIYR